MSRGDSPASAGAGSRRPVRALAGVTAAAPACGVLVGWPVYRLALLEVSDPGGWGRLSASLLALGVGGAVWVVALLGGTVLAARRTVPPGRRAGVVAAAVGVAVAAVVVGWRFVPPAFLVVPLAPVAGGLLVLGSRGVRWATAVLLVALPLLYEALGRLTSS
ncbi:hypothetical protein CLV92_104206 [Kineococcus xinjiangensis]|uniref:Uncharacterized protein n=1 Tax=Kineococcus xinjiangensis TaxID=512762 RepID=A0A2S6ITB4_9ACTN|nr:hypothetical protein [Kineococcus xinjiangensis]PPK97385.1 hypothetical protein CLV92_104206 [Kineococcus xinjiangensis]